MKFRRFFITILMGIATSGAFGASLHIDFENEADDARWELNRVKNEQLAWSNFWHIGTAEKNAGERGLYISCDRGRTASYSNANSCWMTALYKDIALEAGKYTLSFDWKALGGLNSPSDGSIKVFIVPAEYYDRVNCALNNVTPKWIGDNDIDKMLTISTLAYHNSGSWQTAQGNFTTDGEPFGLLFAWQNSGSTPRNPSGCIDNIDIASDNCGEPTNMQTDNRGNGLKLTWQGNYEQYNLRYKLAAANEWNLQTNISGNEATIQCNEGLYEVALQGICDGDTSVWYRFPLALVYQSKCFDYLRLTDENCSYSTETAANWHDNEFVEKRVDFGPSAIESYHTVHFTPNEIDPRTENSVDNNGNSVEPLKTVPKGSLASVRIGNWDQAHVARVSYRHTVSDDANASILLLKYAVVLQIPNHTIEEQPRFTLEILDAQTREKLDDCSQADFAATTNMKGWNKTTYNDDSRDVVWKDWTTVGINLEAYVGREILVQLTVYGCTADVHYGYAYFVLNCTHGMIDGMNCGDTPTTEFRAPEGFNYRWYNAANPRQTLGTESRFEVSPNDRTRYKVDVIYPTDASCYFTLDACAIPRYPVADFELKHTPRECRNIFTVVDKNHIDEKNLDTGEMTTSNEPLQTTEWTLDGKPLQLNAANEFELANENGQHELSVYVGLCNGLCSDTKTLAFDVEELFDVENEAEKQLCLGNYYEYAGRKFTSDTTFVETHKTTAGCDSIVRLSLQFVDKKRTEIDSTICHSDAIDFDGKQLNISGLYTDTLTSSLGCDSLVVLQLTVVPQIEPRPLARICADDQNWLLALNRTEFFDSIAIIFSQKAIEMGFENQTIIPADTAVEILQPLPQNVRAGNYQLTIDAYSKACGTEQTQLNFAINLPSEIIETKFGDVLAILNSDYNGGYQLSDFQWFTNNEPIANATSSNLYLPNGIDEQAQYGVQLTCNGERLEICPFSLSNETAIGTIESDNLLENSCANVGGTIKIGCDEPFSARWIAIDGKIVSDHKNCDSTIGVPNEKGIFMLQIATKQRTKCYKITVL